MDLLPSEGANSNGALMLNLESSLSSELPPLTFLADASLWFEEQQHQRRPNQTTVEATPENQDDSVDDADANVASNSSTLNSTRSSTPPIAHFSTANVTPSETPNTIVCLEADRLEVARIMEQLKQGWDGTAAQPETSTPSTTAESIGCQFDNDTLSVDLRPLFTEQLRNTISVHHKVPMKLQFPFGTFTLQIETAKLWPKPRQICKIDKDSAEDGSKITAAVNEVIDSTTGNKTWKCHLCVNRVYASRSGLASHLLIHFNRRPFQCEVCSKSFRQFGHLQSHMALHSGQKHFRCDKCSSSFTQKHHLTSHQANDSCFGQKERAAVFGAGLMTKTARVSRCKCSSCGKRCRSITELKKHLISAHGTATSSGLERSELCPSKSRSDSSTVEKARDISGRRYK